MLFYISLVISNMIWRVLDDNLLFILSIVMIVFGVNMLFKGKLLRSVSTLWFALILIFCAVFILLLEIFNKDISEYYFIFSLIPIIPSIMCVFILDAKIFLKVIILNISIAIPVILLQFLNIEWYYILAIGLLTLAFGIVICRSINLDKEKI